MSQIKHIRTSLIIPNPKNSRRSLSDTENADAKLYQTIDGLAANIASVGLINALTVTPFGNEYMIIAGERRYKACVQLGWTEVPCVVMEATDIEQYKIIIAENWQRKDKTDVEKAEEIHKYQLLTALTLREIAKEIGTSHVHIKWLLDLYSYPTEVKQMVKSAEITAYQARPLSQITKDDHTEQLQVKTAEHIRDNHLNYNGAKETVSKINSLPSEVKEELANNPEVTVSDVITPEICSDTEEDSTAIVNDWNTFLVIGKQLYSMLDKGNVKTHFNAYNRIVMKKYLLSLKERINELLEEIDYL